MLERAGWRMAAGLAVTALVLAALFGAAGRLDWYAGWGYIAVVAAGQLANTLVLRRHDPGLLRRRGRVGEGTETRDVLWLRIFALLYLSVPLAGALDARFGWSAMPRELWLLGAGLYAAFFTVITRAMLVNTHFEKTVRIQRELGHHVVEAGPYSIVRHPGYAATIPAFLLATPLLVLSWWAFVPAAATAAWIVVRTVYEDRFLRRELPGYEEYARRVRYRLVPGLW